MAQPAVLAVQLFIGLSLYLFMYRTVGDIEKARVETRMSEIEAGS